MWGSWEKGWNNARTWKISKDSALDQPTLGFAGFSSLLVELSPATEWAFDFWNEGVYYNVLYPNTADEKKLSNEQNIYILGNFLVPENHLILIKVQAKDLSKLIKQWSSYKKKRTAGSEVCLEFRLLLCLWIWFLSFLVLYFFLDCNEAHFCV